MDTGRKEKSGRIMRFLMSYNGQDIPMADVVGYMKSDAIMVEPILSALNHIGLIEIVERDSDESIKIIRVLGKYTE